MTPTARRGSNVFRLVTRLNVGGPARQALMLTKSLDAEFPTLLAAGCPAESEGELLDAAVPVQRVPLVRPIQPAVDLHAIRVVRKLIRGHRSALVHTHMAKAGAVGRIAARSLPDRPRTVHTFHGHVLDGYFRRGTERAFIELERGLARSTDVLVAVSPEIRDELLALRIGRPEQYHVIPLGLDLEPLLAVDKPSGVLRTELGLEAEVPLVGVVGRLVPIKDHATLLAAIEQVDGVHLAVIGDGELRAVLEARVRATGLGDRVHFTGWRYDLADTLADLDAVVLTSRNEGTPVALIEALAAGRAVVATAVGGVPSVVVDGESGLLVPAGDAQAIAGALACVLSSPELSRRLAECGRQHVQGRFGQTRLVEDLRAMYRELLRR